MTISEEEFIRLSKKMDAETDAFLENTSDPQELHLFAELWNWDTGSRPLLQLVTHPNCDAGTALMVYWLAAPEYYLAFDIEDPECDQEAIELISTIEKRYVNNEYKTQSISFDPKKSGMTGAYGTPKKWKRNLPAIMYDAIP